MAGFAPIQTVDVGGLIGVYEGAKDRRVRQMLLERQIAKEDRAIEKESKLMSAYGRLFAKGGDPASAGSGASAPPSSVAPGTGFRGQGVVTGIAPEPDPQAPPPPLAMNQDGTPPTGVTTTAVAPATLVDPAQLAPRTDGIKINQDALRELYVLDPPAAMQIQKSVFEMNSAQLKAMRESGETLASIADDLQTLPYEQRATELQNYVQLLEGMGIDTSQISRADLTDRGLTRYRRVGIAYKDLASDAREERKFAAQEADRAADNARADRGLAVREGALGLARERSARAAKKGGGGSEDNSDLSYLMDN